ncbi:MAG: hypothetical protein QXT53_00850 [Ignisphaera sp.]
MRSEKAVAAVTMSMMLALIAIGLIALAEKGPPQIQVFIGASPYNTGPIGTFKLVEILRSRYPNTYAIASIQEMENLLRGGDKCLYIVISPEIGYNNSDVGIIMNSLRECRYTSALIADESTYSNILLKGLNSSIRVMGNIIIDYVNGPYVYAFITIPSNSSNNVTYYLRLDIASKLLVSSSQVQVTGYAETGDVVAAEEVSNSGVHVFVIGDGSIFLNQVLESNVTTYRDFALALVDYLCRFDVSCRIVVDGSRYPGSTPEKLYSSVYMYSDPTTLVLSFIARLFHPSTWLPPAIEFSNNVFRVIFSIYSQFILVSLAMGVAIYLFLKRRIFFVADHRLEEQREIESFVTGDLRDAILRGKIRLSKQDFITLFSIVDTVTQTVYGLELCDERLLNVIPKRDVAEKYLNRMCRLYKKALGRSFLPLVLSWNKTIARMIRESEEFLSMLGQTISGEKGVEYILIK